jgi:hypothetical protein
LRTKPFPLRHNLKFIKKLKKKPAALGFIG